MARTLALPRASVIVFLIAIALGLTACGGGPFERPPTIDRISPTVGTIGTEVVIYGSGFTPEANDIAFTHEQIDFQGSDTGYVNGVASSDGRTLRIALPEALGACPYSQMDQKEACPEVAIHIPTGRLTVSVVNRNGRSNGVVFERLASDREAAEATIYSSPAFELLNEILSEIQRRTGGPVSVRIDECADTFCVDVWIERDVSNLRRQIPSHIEGYEVRIETGRRSRSARGPFPRPARARSGRD